MRKGTWSVAAVIVLLSGAGAVLSPGVLAADTRVLMGSQNEPFKFLPPEISVPVGATVEWVNDTALEHDVKADDGSFGSDLLGEGEKFEFRFTKPGEFTYFCAPHKDAGMKGTVRVTGGASTPTTAATTTTQAPAPGASTTTTTAKGSQPSSTTTTRAGAGDGGSTTTTTTAGGGVTSTTQAAATTPTSAPDTAGVTATTGAEGHGGEEAAADSHGSEGGSDEETNPVAVGLIGVLTAVLTAVSLKLLTGKP